MHRGLLNAPAQTVSPAKAGVQGKRMHYKRNLARKKAGDLAMEEQATKRASLTLA